MHRRYGQGEWVSGHCSVPQRSYTRGLIKCVYVFQYLDCCFVMAHLPASTYGSHGLARRFTCRTHPSCHQEQRCRADCQ